MQTYDLRERQEIFSGSGVMDDLRNNASTGIAMSVVRRFVPSRIEGQLLTQVFELACRGRADAAELFSTGPKSAPKSLFEKVPPTAIDAHVARRPAA